MIHPSSSPTESTEPSTVLFANVRVFDGHRAVTALTNVLIVGNKITKISKKLIRPNTSAVATVIEGGGRTLMPGLIDAHAHIMFESIPQSTAMVADVGYITLVAAKAAGKMLLRGFTTIRDLGGPSFL